MTPMPVDSEAQIALWRRLVLRGTQCGVGYADAQDLAGQALLKALETFDGARGAFAPFCRTVHANILRNHWRDRKTLEAFDPEREDHADPRDPIEDHMDREMREKLREIADRILSELSPEQAAFFLALREAHEEIEYGAVSEAARLLGIPPLRGHDLYKQIRRKARKHLGRFEAVIGLEETAPGAPPEPAGIIRGASRPRREGAFAEPPLEHDPRLRIVMRCASAGYQRFDESLTPALRARLAALFT